MSGTKAVLLFDSLKSGHNLSELGIGQQVPNGSNQAVFRNRGLSRNDRPCRLGFCCSLRPFDTRGFEDFADAVQ